MIFPFSDDDDDRFDLEKDVLMKMTSSNDETLTDFRMIVDLSQSTRRSIDEEYSLIIDRWTHSSSQIYPDHVDEQVPPTPSDQIFDIEHSLTEQWKSSVKKDLPTSDESLVFQSQLDFLTKKKKKAK